MEGRKNVVYLRANCTVSGAKRQDVTLLVVAQRRGGKRGLPYDLTEVVATGGEKRGRPYDLAEKHHS
jgi:hypothetical protein